LSSLPILSRSSISEIMAEFFYMTVVVVVVVVVMEEGFYSFV
jgi:hypothetical protein